MMQHFVQAVIFDMDGVLIDSEPLHFEVDALMFKQLGITVSQEYFDLFVGMTGPNMWDIVKKNFPLEQSAVELTEMQTNLKVKAIEESSYTANDGILELMAFLHKKNIRMCIGSSSPIPFIQAVIKKIGIESYIPWFISGDDVSQGKPAPDIFLAAAKKLNLNPEHCLVIEDSKNGVLAAKNAGMPVIGYQNPNSGNQDLSHANLMVKSIHEIQSSSFF